MMAFIGNKTEKNRLVKGVCSRSPPGEEHAEPYSLEHSTHGSDSH